MGTLYIVSTPIGNLDDISIRALKTLFSVDVIASEDTRRTGTLLRELRIRYQPILQQFGDLVTTEASFVRYDDRMEHAATPELLDILEKNGTVALVSDAGTPLISDPGYIIVTEARKRGIPVVSIPGASAVLAALSGSGLPAGKFLFLGYPPEKQAHRITVFRSLLSISQSLSVTHVLYCAPHKLHTTLEDMKSVFGDKDITIYREITKVHEDHWRGAISAALDRSEIFKGELVLLIHLAQ